MLTELNYRYLVIDDLKGLGPAHVMIHTWARQSL